MTRNTIELGDAYAMTRRMADGVIDTTVTSVPYWQQRKYLPPGHKLEQFEMGRERSPDDYVTGLGDVFNQVRLKTKPKGTCWVNIGDKIADGKGPPSFYKGEIMGLPWRFAQEMRMRGWRLLREIVWNKPDANPRASKNAPLISHEHVFLFARGEVAYFDGVAISDPAKYPPPGESRPSLRGPRTVWDIPTSRLDARKLLADVYEDGIYYERDESCPVHGTDPRVAAGPLFDAASPPVSCSCSEIPVDFFAAMPPRLAEKCILASTSEAGNCSVCGEPALREIISERIPTRPGIRPTVDLSGKARRDPLRHVTVTETVGWTAGCTCGAALSPPLVFDPFCGSGTTPMVAAALGRDYYAIELNPATRKLAQARVGSHFERTYPR